MINKAILVSLTVVAGTLCSSNLYNPQKPEILALSNARREIKAINFRLSQSLATGKIDDVAACYTPDAQFMAPNMPLVNGRTGIREIYLGMFRSGATNLEFSSKEVNGCSSFLEEVGTYKLSTSTGKQIDQGKYLVVWKREAKRWKLYRDCFNSNLPAKISQAQSGIK